VGGTAINPCHRGVRPRLTSRKERTERLYWLAARHSKALLRHQGVVAVGVGLPRGTQAPVLEVYVRQVTPELRRLLPRTLDGETVNLVETGPARVW